MRVVGLTLLMLLVAEPICAQQPSPPPKQRLDIEVLIQSQPSFRVAAQDWGREFQTLGYSPRFRLPRPGDELRIEDSTLDDQPVVHVIGGMSKDGAIEFANRKFTLADLKPLAEFLDELATFGAGGRPETNPTWGLTNENLAELIAVMAEPIAAPITLDSPAVTLDSIGVPASIRLSYSEAARSIALGKRPDTAPESLDLTGVSRGTAIAIVLAQYGLGFRPQRNEAGTITLEVDVGDETSNLWPAGWKTQESAGTVVPAWIKSIPVDLDEVEVSTITSAFAERLQVSYFASTHSLARSGIDLDVVTYTHRNSKVSPFRLLTAVGGKLHLGFDIRADEAGHVFLWVTTEEEMLAFRKRFESKRQP